MSIDTQATTTVPGQIGGAKEIAGLPAGTQVEVSERTLDGSLSVRLTVPGGEGEKPLVIMRSFKSAGEFRAWANDDKKPLALTGDVGLDEFEKLRHTIDAQVVGGRVRIDAEAVGRGPKGAFAVLQSTAYSTEAGGGQVTGRQGALVGLGFLDAKTEAGKSSIDGVQGERTNRATKEFMLWATSTGVLTDAELAGSPISQTRIDRSVEMASRAQDMLRNAIKTGDTDFLSRCGLTDKDIAAYTKDPESFSLKNHPGAFAQIFSWQTGTHQAVADALRESPRSQISQDFLTGLGNPRHAAVYAFEPKHIAVIERYVNALAGV